MECSSSYNGLRIIGVQIFEESRSFAKRVLLPGWYPFVRCKKDIGTSLEIPEIEDVLPSDFFQLTERGPQISVCAIVGKNGSGKSTLLEVVCRIINNFFRAIQNDNDENKNAFGINARLHFELDGTQYYIHSGDIVSFAFRDKQGKWIIESERIADATLSGKANEILTSFFYTLVFNFGMFAFNPNDYRQKQCKDDVQNLDGSWIEFLLNKNDGYYTPLTIVPYREEGVIDVNNENDLAELRVAVYSLLFHSQNKQFIEKYKPLVLHYKLDDQYKFKQLEKYAIHPDVYELKRCYPSLISHFEDAWIKILEEEGIDITNRKNHDVEVFYLARKTIKIITTYPQYKELFGWNEFLRRLRKKERDRRSNRVITDSDGNERFIIEADAALAWLNAHTKQVNNVVRELYETRNNHITTKIQQCIKYIRDDEFSYVGEFGEKTVDVLLGGKQYKSYEDVMALLPPSFFIREMYYTPTNIGAENSRKIRLAQMSSGERLLLSSVSYVLYHIRNLSSIKTSGNQVVHYNHINLVFDEAELYYHPEYQRTFLYDMIKKLGDTVDQKQIHSINIIIATHSPFILSDIPSCNILRLDDGSRRENKKNSFAANFYDIMVDGFFMDAFVGKFAEEKINKIASLLRTEDLKADINTDWSSVRKAIAIIDDEFIRDTLKYQLENKLKS